MSNTFKIILAVVVVVISFTIIQRVITPEYIETVKEVTVVDSTKVDSLEQHIRYLESIPKDTTIVKIEIPDPTIEDSLYKYHFPFRDSLISSMTRISTKDEIVDYEFEYFYHAQLVEERVKTITKTTYLTTIKTITKEKQQRAYLSLGAEVGLYSDFYSFSPKAMYTLQSGESFGVRYDIINNGFAVFYSRPIRFKLPF